MIGLNRQSLQSKADTKWTKCRQCLDLKDYSFAADVVQRGNVPRVAVRRFLFELITPPLRPRYRARYMDPEAVRQDEELARRRDEQFANWCRQRERSASVGQPGNRSTLRARTMAKIRLLF